MLPKKINNLVVVLGDQLNLDSSALEDFNRESDLVWMAEASEESTHVPSSKIRTALFLSAMRHFAQSVRDKKWPLSYTQLDADGHSGSVHKELEKAIKLYKPEQILVTQPGDYRSLEGLRLLSEKFNTPLIIKPDRYFFTDISDFKAYASKRKQLRMEYWYRELRQKFNILMDKGEPVSGVWNFDAENRESFGKTGPVDVPPPHLVKPDTITKEVIELVDKTFSKHVGNLKNFGWPVTREDAIDSLNQFISQRLPLFGKYEDAMWTKEPWLYHSHLSAALNLKLLSAQEVVSAAEDAYTSGLAPLASVEGFIRQILGWREYVRGIYWINMPQYVEKNALDASLDLPSFYWSAQTDMVCLKSAISQTLEHGYAHHIQRLMVLGLYTLMYGVKPQQVHEWFLSVFVDAVEWVELPNTLGMSQYGDGGQMASKPYVASGKYVQRMSNYCSSCVYNPAESSGPKACPMTTLYWDFLIKHKDSLAKNPRMVMQIKNLNRLSEEKVTAIQKTAQEHRLVSH
jgi:deoxyribodipyrimidine photolyase-related protein